MPLGDVKYEKWVDLRNVEGQEGREGHESGPMVCHFHDVIRSMDLGSTSMCGGGSAETGTGQPRVDLGPQQRGLAFSLQTVMLWVAKRK